MKELKLDGLTEEQSRRKIAIELHDFVLDVCESLTYDELKKLEETADYDHFHKLCIDNDLIMRSIHNAESDSENWDSYIAALELIATHNDNWADKNDMLEDFKSRIKPVEDTYYFWFIEKPHIVKEGLVNLYILSGIKLIWEYLEDLTKNFQVTYGKYEARLLCECGTLYKHRLESANIDFREYVACCSDCGRCSSTFELVSVKQIFLNKTTKKKRLFLPGTKTRSVKIPLNMVRSEHKLLDRDAEKYGYKKHTKKKIKTIKESMG